MINYKANYFGKISVAFLALTTLVTSLAFSGTAAATPHGEVMPSIIGGHAASEPYPGTVSIQAEVLNDPNFHICGATLVSRQYVVTNAHCVTDFDGNAIDPSLLHLRIGSHNRLEGGVKVGVSKVLPHADWDWGTGNDPIADIALLRLDEYVQLQPFEVASQLAQRDATTRLLGWGSTEPAGDGPAPFNLQELDTKLDQPQKCADAGITAGEICVYNPNETDGPCFGDSGGPALQKVGSDRWSVIGGTSRGGSNQCGVGNTVYTDHTYYRKWMYEVMRTGTVPSSTTKAQSTDKSLRYNWALPVQPWATSR